MRGIGPWTAGYVALRVLSAPDVLLNTDLVLLQGAARLGLPATPRGIADYGATLGAVAQLRRDASVARGAVAPA